MKAIDRYDKKGKLSIALQTVIALILVCLLASAHLFGADIWRFLIAVILIIVLWANGIDWVRQRPELDVSVVSKHELLTVLAKYRHEVLNQVQLIKAYIQLGKEERVASALNSLVQAARQHSELGQLWNPIISYAAISAKIDYPGLSIEIHTQLDGQLPSNQREHDGLLAVRDQMPKISDQSSNHLAEILYDLHGLAQELHEDTSADIQWLLTLIPDGNGVRLNLVLLGEAVTEAFCQEIVSWIGHKGLILLCMNIDRLHQQLLENRVEINARLVSLTGQPIWVSQTTPGE
ncbi:MAG: hypothetical protein JWN30_871 [Bacilli bacterium]|nr:hypothetical protein [Bacilli bacterium]